MGWKEYYLQTKKVVFKEGIKSIGAGAFEKFQNLESIVLPRKLCIIKNLSLIHIYLWYGDASYTAEKQYLKLMEDKVINKTLMLMSEDWTDEGIVDGYVYNTSGKALADAKVEVYSGVDYTVEEPEMILYTDAKGYFNTDFMITGGYTFVISKEDVYKRQDTYSLPTAFRTYREKMRKILNKQKEGGVSEKKGVL